MVLQDLEVVVGTYENLILGFKIIENLSKAKGPSLESSFTDDSHRGALRSLAVSPSGVLASSSTDDSIRLHNLRKRKEIGGLFEHSGTVNCLQFFPGGHMFSASEDGSICMWKCKNWEVMKTLKGHKSQVMSVDVHPTGKLGLSCGHDKSFLLWDLVTGKLAFQRKLQEPAQTVLFTADGDFYVLVYQRKIEVCALSDTKVVKEIPAEWRINAVCLLQENVIAIGGDHRDILIIDLLKGKTLLTLDAGLTDNSDFNSRVRSLCKVVSDDDTFLFAGTSSGIVKGFKLSLTQKQPSADVVLAYETRVRLTCMAVFNGAQQVNDTEHLLETTSAQVPKKGKKRKIDKGKEECGDGAGSDEIEENDDSDNARKQQNYSSPSKLSKKKKVRLQEAEIPSQSKKKMAQSPSVQQKQKKGNLHQGKNRSRKNKKKNK